MTTTTTSTAERSLHDKTLDYWHLQRAARGLPSTVKSPTVEKVLGAATIALRTLNPHRPLALRWQLLKWEAIDHKPSTGEKVAATILPLRASK